MINKNKKVILRGKNHGQYTHGLSKTRQYAIWNGILTRCNNQKTKSYETYGGKGIKVCKEWLMFSNFWLDMKDTYFENATIDRIDNNKGYSKENCRWATVKQQAQNKKKVTLYTHEGTTMCAGDWDKKLGLKNGTVYSRIKTGWDTLKAITTPKIKYTGTTFDEKRGKWRAYMRKKGKQYFIGRFKTQKEALKARKQFIASLQTFLDEKCKLCGLERSEIKRKGFGCRQAYNRKHVFI
jgi:hypothetical protein